MAKIRLEVITAERVVFQDDVIWWSLAAWGNWAFCPTTPR
jgi:hypothetical protein